MASGSLVLPPPKPVMDTFTTRQETPEPLPAVQHTSPTSEESTVELSEVDESVAAEDSASSPESPKNDDVDAYSSSGDDDNESQAASEDADYEVDDDPVEDVHDLSASSKTEKSSRGTTREKTEDRHWEDNPELYGLRRSGRARHTAPQVFDSSTEDDDDDDSDVVSSRKRRKPAPARSTKSSKKATPSVSDNSSAATSESEDDYGAQESSRRRTKKRRRLSDESPPAGEVRFSTRRSNKVMNYNEDDAELEDEEDAEAIEMYGYREQEEDTNIIDIVLLHRVKEGVDEKNAIYDPRKLEFLVKWKNQAHIHASWEDVDSLKQRCKNTKKVDNYVRAQQEHHRVLNDPYKSPEEKENYELEINEKAARYEDSLHIDRIFLHKDDEEGRKYLVKWKEQYYDASTWEEEEFVKTIGQKFIDQYWDRAMDHPPSSAKESNPRTRSDHKMFVGQPEWIQGGELRDFQITGLNFMAYNWSKNQSCVLADEMGLGKTVQTVAFMNFLKHNRRQQGPFLIVSPLSIITSWQDTFDRWAPDMNYLIYTGGPQARDMIREHEMFADEGQKKTKFNIMITTYEFVIKDWELLKGIPWQFLAVDEAHRLKNREAILYIRLNQYKTDFRLLITGTPLQNNLKELRALFDFIQPGLLQYDEDLDLSSTAAAEQVHKIQDVIRPFMLRRMKKDVEQGLPPKREKIIRVPLSSVQLRYYKAILTRNYDTLNANATTNKVQSLLNICVELKKVSNHPFMIPGVQEYVFQNQEPSRSDYLKALVMTSGKMVLLDNILGKLKNDGHRVLIFCQMVGTLDYLAEYLNLKGLKFQRLDGTVAARPRKIAIDHFNAEGSQDFCFLLSTRAGGLGINLMTADTVILFDSDWNPQADMQAMARAHRIGQTKPVTVYRFVAGDTLEEEIIERCKGKIILEHAVINLGVAGKNGEFIDQYRKDKNSKFLPNAKELKRILQARAKKMFETSVEENQNALEKMDIEDVLVNAEDHNTEAEEGMVADGGEDFLKQFEVSDFKPKALDENISWDQIIPEEDLQRMREEQRKQQEEEMLKEHQDFGATQRRAATKKSTAEIRKAKRIAKEMTMDVVSDGDDDDYNDNPSRPLKEREVRNLYRAFGRFGSLEDCWDEIVKESGLETRDPEVIKSTVADLISYSKEAIRKHKEGVDPNKKEKKAILFDYKGARKLNADVIIGRTEQLKSLRKIVLPFKDNLTKFRIDGPLKSAHWSCEWGVREDSMLLVGIIKHGYGNWVAIRDDPELDMKEKFFLEEHRIDKKEARSKENGIKSPGAVHLVRRSDYLMQIIREREEKEIAKTLDAVPRRMRVGSVGSPAPRKSKSKSASVPLDSGRRRERELERQQERGHNNDRDRDRDSSQKKRRREDDRYDDGDRPRLLDKHRRSLDGSRKPVGDNDRAHDKYQDRLHPNDRNYDDRRHEHRDRHRDDRRSDHHDRHRDDRRDDRRHEDRDRRLDERRDNKHRDSRDRDRDRDRHSHHHDDRRDEKNGHRHGDRHDRNGENKKSRDAQKDKDRRKSTDKKRQIVEGRLSPIQPYVDRMMDYHTAGREDRISMVKELLMAAGEIISSQTRPGSREYRDGWQQLMRYWPSKDKSWKDLESFYHRLLEDDEAKKRAAKKAQSTPA